MQITLELPEDIARGLECKWNDLPRAALESLALEAYRSHALTAAQLGRLLGFETRMQVDAFLKEHEIYDFTAADFEQECETLRQLRAREAQHWPALEDDRRGLKVVLARFPSSMRLIALGSWV